MNKIKVCGLSREVLSALKLEAVLKGISRNQLIVELLKEHARPQVANLEEQRQKYIDVPEGDVYFENSPVI